MRKGKTLAERGRISGLARQCMGGDRRVMIERKVEGECEKINTLCVVKTTKGEEKTFRKWDGAKSKGKRQKKKERGEKIRPG